MKHVAVLKGGWSAEREVSLNSGAACAKALRELGYNVTEVDVGRDIAQILSQLKPDIAFNALHGNYGEDGCIQGVLEVLNIPYTHSGVMASSVAMDKPMAKNIFTAIGLACPQGVALPLSILLKKGDPMPRPFVVKPASEGSSVGVYIIPEEDNRPLSVILEKEHEMDRVFLVEEYIAGRELTVAVLADKALGVTELVVNSGFYDYENKYTDGKTTHLCPAPLADGIAQQVMDIAQKAHQALGCRGVSRADFRYDEAKDKGKFYLLEVNTQPGMTALSLLPEQAAHAGISFNELVGQLVDAATLGN